MDGQRPGVQVDGEPLRPWTATRWAWPSVTCCPTRSASARGRYHPVSVSAKPGGCASTSRPGAGRGLSRPCPGVRAVLPGERQPADAVRGSGIGLSIVHEYVRPRRAGRAAARRPRRPLPDRATACQLTFSAPDLAGGCLELAASRWSWRVPAPGHAPPPPPPAPVSRPPPPHRRRRPPSRPGRCPGPPAARLRRTVARQRAPNWGRKSARWAPPQ